MARVKPRLSGRASPTSPSAENNEPRDPISAGPAARSYREFRERIRDPVRVAQLATGVTFERALAQVLPEQRVVPAARRGLCCGYFFPASGARNTAVYCTPAREESLL